MFTLGVALWLIYGVVIESWPLIVTNALTFLFALSILLMKLKQMSK
jgi:MtN3 and saliva related transmembrane protein